MSDADAAPRSVGVVVVAAGSGTRLRADRPKAFVELGGRSLLERSVGQALRAGVSSVAVVVPAALVEEATTMLAPLPADQVHLRVVAGGEERTDSVRAGLRAVDPSCDIILVHDAARCLTPLTVFERVAAAVVAGAAGAVPGLPVVDTIKTVDERGVITSTPDRASLRSVQTPQAFAAQVLRAAYATSADGAALATDDAALVERSGHDVVVVEGDRLAFKITTPEDLRRAEALVSEDVR